VCVCVYVCAFVCVCVPLVWHKKSVRVVLVLCQANVAVAVLIEN
jgi:hypothetical protein